MLIQYIQAAMRCAKYETIEDGTIVGTITGLQGILANAATIDACREELQEVLEEWIVVGLRLGMVIPDVDGVTLMHELEVA
jgi:predicted RNase H-like HicB family nuclease